MTKSVEIIQKEAFDKMDNLLNQSELTNPQIHEFIKSCLAAAFDKVAPSDKNKLYKEFSRQLHPDIFMAKKKELYDYLNQRGLQNIPQQLLNNFKANNIIADLAISPRQAVDKVFFLLLNLLQPMLFAYKRYPEPLRSFANYTSWAINVPLVLCFLPFYAALIAAFLVKSNILNPLGKWILNKITQGQFYIVLDEAENDEKNLAQARRLMIETARGATKGKYFVSNKNQAEIDNLTDAQMLEEFRKSFRVAIQAEMRGAPLSSDQLEQEVEKQLKSLIKETYLPVITMQGFAYLNLIARSHFRALLQPLPKNFLEVTLNLLVIKPLQVLTALIFIPTAGILEAINYAVSIAFLAAMASLFLIKASSLLVINFPLYALDGIDTLITSCCRPKNAPYHEEEKKEELGSSNQRMNGLLDVRESQSTNSSPQASAPQVHYRSPLASPNTSSEDESPSQFTGLDILD